MRLLHVTNMTNLQTFMIMKFRLLCLFALTFHEYEARFVFGFRLDYRFILVCVKLFCVLFMCDNQYKLNNSSEPR
jgi:hypothetical protein